MSRARESPCHTCRESSRVPVSRWKTRSVAGRRADGVSSRPMRISTCLLVTLGSVPAFAGSEPIFTFQQREMFSSPGALCNAWADIDGDGDPDLAVSFDSGEIRLYRNDDGILARAAASGLPSSGAEFRGLSWGDFDADGDPDLYAGVSTDDGSARNLLFRNEGGSRVPRGRRVRRRRPQACRHAPVELGRLRQRWRPRSLRRPALAGESPVPQ